MSIQSDTKSFSGPNLSLRPVPFNFFGSGNEDYYKNDYQEMGTAIIFNQNDCEGCDKRDGAFVDSSNLKNVLKHYQFNYKIYSDYTKEEIEEKLKEASRINHSRSNCLLVVMMSHGDENKNVYTKNGPMEVEILWKYFTSDRCESLCGKPKLFFVQACRGSTPDFGSLNDHQIEVDKTNRMSLQSNEELKQNIPVMADILVMFSSAEGYPSFRDPFYGSWFIEAFCEVMKKYLTTSQEKDLMTLLTEVNRYVAFSKEAFDPEGDIHGHKQMPVIMSMLTKKFVFNRNLLRLTVPDSSQ